MTDIVRYTLMLLGAAAVAAFSGCSSKVSSRPVVTVSIDPQKWLLDSIVGDKVEVRSLLPGDANPENFDPPLAALKSSLRRHIVYEDGSSSVGGCARTAPEGWQRPSACGRHLGG